MRLRGEKLSWTVVLLEATREHNSLGGEQGMLVGIVVSVVRDAYEHRSDGSRGSI